MGTKYNIVFGVDVSDKSLVDAKSKIEYVLMKSGITIAQYTDFDGLIAITSEEQQIIKYVGSFHEGMESVGFVIEKDMTTLAEVKTILGPVVDNIKLFSMAVDEVRRRVCVNAGIREGKNMIAFMLRAFSPSTTQMLVRGIAGDQFYSFFNSDIEFDEFIVEKKKEIEKLNFDFLDSD